MGPCFKGRFMNIVIINKDLGLYLANLDRWTANVQEAQKFGSTIEALDFCLNNYLTDLSILMHFDKNPGDVCLIEFQPDQTATAAGESVTKIRR